MKRIILVLLIIFCLVGCTEETGEPAPDLTAVEAAVAAFNAENARKSSFRLGVSEKGADEVLFFTSGTTAVRKSGPTAMSGRMTQIKGDDATTSDIFYKAGAYYYDSGYGKYYTVMDSGDFLGQFICADVPFVTDGAVGYATAEVDGGVKHRYRAECSEEFGALFGESVYEAAGLRSPDRKRSTFTDAGYEYVIKDGTLTAVKLTFTAILYETAAYYPEYVPSDAELRREFSVTFELSIASVGSDVEIAVPDTADYTFIG